MGRDSLGIKRGDLSERLVFLRCVIAVASQCRFFYHRQRYTGISPTQQVRVGRRPVIYAS
ncbi:hypothetical protein [Enterobacter sp. AG5470]|uniref:hypothetical protein n=1 Tax=Kosakonia sp. WA-90 TaxID=3153576 RepID=UPI0010687F86